MERNRFILPSFFMICLLEKLCFINKTIQASRPLMYLGVGIEIKAA